MHRVATLNSWLRTNNDIVFNCDRDDLTGQLITTIVAGDPRDKLGKVQQLGTVSLSDRIVKITTRNIISEENKVTPSNNKELISLLKSHLQKCIRRGKSELAVKTARHLLELDAVNLLRRLPIIIPEDVMMLPHFDATVWLMMAYPFRGLTNEDKTWVLGSVKRLADFAWVDILYDEAPDEWMPDPEDEKIGAIALRHAFGGTRSDMDLLRHVAYTWKQRYSEKSKVGEFAKLLQNVTKCIVQIPLDTVKPLERSEFLLAAVDHHVTPITSLLPKSILNPRQMIWDCSSSINFRTRLDFSEHDKPYWSREDKNHIIDAQERLLDRMFPDEGISFIN